LVANIFLFPKYFGNDRIPVFYSKFKVNLVLQRCECGWSLILRGGSKGSQGPQNSSKVSPGDSPRV